MLSAALQLQHDAGLILSNEQDVVVGHAYHIRSEAISGGCDATGGAVIPGSSGGTLHGSYGLVEATYYSGNPGTLAVSDMQCLHVVQRLLPGSVAVILGGDCWTLGLYSDILDCFYWTFYVVCLHSM